MRLGIGFDGSRLGVELVGRLDGAGALFVKPVTIRLFRPQVFLLTVFLRLHSILHRRQIVLALSRNHRVVDVEAHVL